MNILNYLHNELAFLTVGTAPEFMKLVGGFQWDKITISPHDASCEIFIHELGYYYAQPLSASQIGPILFRGGPTELVVFKGSLLTCVVDRAMHVACEKGLHYVQGLISYLKETEVVV